MLQGLPKRQARDLYSYYNGPPDPETFEEIFKRVTGNEYISDIQG